MAPMEVPVKLASGWYLRACKGEMTPRAIERLEGTVGHRRDHDGVAPCYRRRHLVQILLRARSEHTAHLLTHLLHLIGTKLGSAQFAAGARRCAKSGTGELQLDPAVSCVSSGSFG